MVREKKRRRRDEETTRRGSRSGAVFVLAVATLTGCAMLAGLSEHEASDAPSGALAGSSASGQAGAGSANVLGGTGPVGDAGGAPTAGGGGGKTGAAGMATGGAAAGDGGEGGDAGVAGAGNGGATPDPTAVHGRIVDYWLAPVANVPVSIGLATTVTNDDGEFTIPDVAPEYDVSFVVSLLGQYAEDYAWRFEGLSRRDPTLQVYRGRRQHSGAVLITRGELDLDGSRISLAIAGPNGAHALENVLISSGTGSFTPSVSWAGPPNARATVHALLWEHDAFNLPTAYRSYDSIPVMLDESPGFGASAALDLSDQALQTGIVSGEVADPGDEALNSETFVFVRFPDGAALSVASEFTDPYGFAYLVPVLPNASFTVAAYRYDARGWGVEHRHLTETGGGTTLAFPPPTELVQPENSEDIMAGSSTFQWRQASGGDAPFLFVIEDGEGPPYRAVYVVTSRNEVTLPSFVGFELRADTYHTWAVQTHGPADSVDAMAGPSGFLDPFSMAMTSANEFGVVPKGPRFVSGRFSTTPQYSVWTAP